jgi:hypothetical protein
MFVSLNSRWAPAQLLGGLFVLFTLSELVFGVSMNVGWPDRSVGSGLVFLFSVSKLVFWVSMIFAGFVFSFFRR